MNSFDAEFWTKRYLNNETGWDLGEPSAPLKAYIDQLKNKKLNILIPGAGNAYEAEYLFKNGFENVSVIDISEEPLKNIKKRVPEFPASHLILSDFLKLQGQYDLIFEQTFFCALHPSLRNAYATQMHQLLKHGGKLVGVLFTDPLNTSTPPFGATKEEYIACFSTFFNLKVFETCHNSIKPRAGRELFIIFEKK
jgi:SAM-dependent methyltransferase